MEISASVKYVGVNDHQVDLFEGQYRVPNGMAYNSYVIMDEKQRSWIRLTALSAKNGCRIWKQYWRERHRIIWLSSIWSPTIPPVYRHFGKIPGGNGGFHGYGF